MGNPPKVKPHHKKSLLDNKSQLRTPESTDSGLLFSFKHFDPRQGQSLHEWQASGLLADALQRFHEHCKTEPFTSCFSDRFKIYGEIPKNSEFSHPDHVPPDASWASMHIKGKPCVVGHLIHNVFYIVFLDSEHKFWPIDIQERGS